MQYLSSERESLIACAQQLSVKALVSGTCGNVSFRHAGSNTFVVTPSGMPFETLKPEDMVECSVEDDHMVHGFRNPSIETPMHQLIYQRCPLVQAVVHTHSRASTALASCHKDLPCFTDTMAVHFRGPVHVTRHAPIGSPDLARNVTEALVTHVNMRLLDPKGFQHRNTCLIANHGCVAVGRSLKEALWLAELLEESCQVYLMSLQLGPVPLTEDEIFEELSWVSGRYGQNQKPAVKENGANTVEQLLPMLDCRVEHHHKRSRTDEEASKE